MAERLQEVSLVSAVSETLERIDWAVEQRPRSNEHFSALQGQIAGEKIGDIVYVINDVCAQSFEVLQSLAWSY